MFQILLFCFSAALISAFYAHIGNIYPNVAFEIFIIILIPSNSQVLHLYKSTRERLIICQKPSSSIRAIPRSTVLHPDAETNIQLPELKSTASPIPSYEIKRGKLHISNSTQSSASAGKTAKALFALLLVHNSTNTSERFKSKKPLRTILTVLSLESTYFL